MITIGGPATRIASVLTALAVILAVIAALLSLLVVVAVSFRAFSSTSGSMEAGPWSLKDTLTVSTVVILIFLLWVCVAAVAWIGRCFSLDHPSLLIGRDGMLFPWLPGRPRGRFIPWKSVKSVGLLDESNLGTLQRIPLIINRISTPGHESFVFRLNTLASDLLDSTTMLGKYYRLTDFFLGPSLEPGDRRRSVLELLAVPMSGKQIVELLQLLLTHEDARESLLVADVVRQVHSQDEMEGLLSDVKTLIASLGLNATAEP